jgi:hypothetical protein
VGVLVRPDGLGFHHEGFAVRVVDVGHSAAVSEVNKKGSRQYTWAVMGGKACVLQPRALPRG